MEIQVLLSVADEGEVARFDGRADEGEVVPFCIARQMKVKFTFLYSLADEGEVVPFCKAWQMKVKLYVFV
jgi:hypothetical protein